MNIKKFMSKTAIVAVSIGLAAVSAHAGPPRDSGRDVIAEAEAFCETFVADMADADQVILANACQLLSDTDGEQVESTGKNACKPGPDLADNGIVSYLNRNCEKNEDAQLKKAGSIVLSMNDVAFKDKFAQTFTAAETACLYVSKATDLIALGKLSYRVDADLVGDAEGIADDLGYDCDVDFDF
jgi:hypothetical protein